MRRSDAERAADEVRHDTVGDVWPVDPIVVAQKLGITVYESELENGVSGIISKLTPDGDVVILLNEEHPHRRQRFTCAHEIGHYIAHKPAGSPFFYKRDDRSSCGIYQSEVFANQFGAALLMPADAVHVMADAGYSLVLMAREFDVSLEAMGHRLANLDLAAAVA